MSKKGYFPNIETNQEFRQWLLQSLSKFSDSHTQVTAWDEVKELMTEHIINTERMNTFLYLISEQNQHMKVTQKKEYIKLFGLAGEIFEETLLPFIPKIMTSLQKKLKENDHHLHEAWSESLGVIVHHVLKNIEDFDKTVENFNSILKTVFGLLNNPNKITQTGAGMWLGKIIQNAPLDALKASLDTLSEKIMSLLSSNSWKWYTQVLESLIWLILAVEEDFEPYAVNFLPYLLEWMAMNDWSTRKMAIDIIYTLAAVLKDVLVPFKAEILEVLNHSRFDKWKPVREATIEAYHTIKNLGGDDETFQEEESQNQKQIQKARPSLRETIKQAKKGKAVEKNEPTFEILDTRDPDKKLSAATQKRIETKRAAMVIQEEKKDNMPASYDDVKSHIFEGPKNSNFFKTQKKVKKNEIEIFTAGDRSKFDYEADFKKHQEQEAKVRSNKTLPNQPEPSIFEPKFRNEESKVKQSRYSERIINEDKKVQNEPDDRQVKGAGIKDPEDIPIQIYVKGNPKQQNQNDRVERNEGINTIKSIDIHDSNFQKESRDTRKTDLITTEDDVEIKGGEYETSMNLLKQHQEMMKKKLNNKPIIKENKEPSPKFELARNVETERESPDRNNNLQRPNFSSYVPQSIPSYRIGTYQPAPMASYQPFPQPTVNSNDVLLQRRIEQFTQQITNSMSNLQSYIRTEIGGIKQRITYLETKIDDMSKRNRNDLDFNMHQIPDFKTNLESSYQPRSTNYLDQMVLPNFENEMLPQFSVEEKLNKSSDSVDEWSTSLMLVQQEKINEAYTLVLNKRDDMLLFKLMGRTGVCYEKLSSDNLEKLLRTISNTLISKAFIDLLLPWVNQLCVEFYRLHPVVQSASVLNGLENSLLGLMIDNQNYLNQTQKDDVEKMYSFISKRNKALNSAN